MSTTPLDKLPRGIWFEAEKKRFRVRKYRNGKPYLVYVATEEEARQVLDKLKVIIGRIPRRNRKERETRPAGAPKFGSIAKQIRET